MDRLFVVVAVRSGNDSTDGIRDGGGGDDGIASVAAVDPFLSLDVVVFVDERRFPFQTEL